MSCQLEPPVMVLLRRLKGFARFTPSCLFVDNGKDPAFESIHLFAAILIELTFIRSSLSLKVLLVLYCSQNKGPKSKVKNVLKFATVDSFEEEVPDPKYWQDRDYN